MSAHLLQVLLRRINIKSINDPPLDFSGRDCNIAEDTYQGLYLCKLTPPQQRIVLGNSTENSCVYVKYDASETTTIPPITPPPTSAAVAGEPRFSLELLLVALVSGSLGLM